jgi:hypothetical protein
VRFHSAGAAALRQQRSTAAASDAGNCGAAAGGGGAVATCAETGPAFGAAIGWAGREVMQWMIADWGAGVVSHGEQFPLY